MTIIADGIDLGAGDADRAGHLKRIVENVIGDTDPWSDGGSRPLQRRSGSDASSVARIEAVSTARSAASSSSRRDATSWPRSRSSTIRRPLQFRWQKWGRPESVPKWRVEASAHREPAVEHRASHRPGYSPKTWARRSTSPVFRPRGSRTTRLAPPVLPGPWTHTTDQPSAETESSVSEGSDTASCCRDQRRSSPSKSV